MNALESADVIVVGSGLYGLTMAERIVEAAHKKVVVVERRSHLGGNAHSYEEPSTGIEVHAYGSHIFHTNNQRVIDYVTQFTAFNAYQHHVYTQHQGRTYSMPINLSTLTAFFERNLTPAQARALVASQVNEIASGTERTFEEKAIRAIGRPLYEALIKGYTAKQWQTDPSQLDPSIIDRLPVRYTFDSRYFGDTFQGIPLDGYSTWLTRMANRPGIEVMLETEFFDLRHHIRADQLIVYTGPLDRFFNYSAGALSWRTLEFQLEIAEVDDFQGTSVMNYADEDVPFTRIHEFKHFHPERTYPPGRTVIMREFSKFASAHDEPYYPVNTRIDRAKVDAYRTLARKEPNVLFGGRLGTYQYLDMHMAIASALTAFDTQVLPWLTDGKPLHRE